MDVLDDRATHEAWGEVLADLGTRTDRESLRLGAFGWLQRGYLFDGTGDRRAALDAYSCAYGRAVAALEHWPDREISELMVTIAVQLSNHHAVFGDAGSALPIYEAALEVCVRFDGDPAFAQHDAQLSLDRGRVLNQLGRCDESIAWFERALEKFPDVSVQRAWALLGRGNARRKAPEAARADYERAIAVAEGWLPAIEASIVISKACHNIATLLHASPSEALPYETRAIDALEEAFEQGAASEIEQHDLWNSRLHRAELLASIDLIAAARQEAQEVWTQLGAIVDQPRLVGWCCELLTRWGEAPKRGTLRYRTVTSPSSIDGEARCTGCGRARSRCGLLIGGSRASICDDCLARPPRVATGACMFCDDRAATALIGRASICDDCLAASKELGDEGRASGKRRMACAFCGRTAIDCGKLISGPQSFICNHCTIAMRTSLPSEDGPLANCRYCAVDHPRLAGDLICGECLDLCGEILDEEYAKSHPAPACGLCSANLHAAERLVLGPDATALCDACFAHLRATLDRHHPFDPALGRRAGAPAGQLDPCTWCQSRKALLVVRGDRLVLCDTCIDQVAQDML